MAIPEITLRRIERWCDALVPDPFKDELRYEFAVTNNYIVTILEVRPAWNGVGGPTRAPVARLRYIRKQWSLYWCDRNQKFHAYDIEPSLLVDDLLDYIENSNDPIFFG